MDDNNPKFARASFQSKESNRIQDLNLNQPCTHFKKQYKQSLRISKCKKSPQIYQWRIGKRHVCEFHPTIYSCIRKNLSKMG